MCLMKKLLFVRTEFVKAAATDSWTTEKPKHLTVGACCCSLSVYEPDLVGTDDKHDAVHIGLRAHFLFHLPKPAIQGIETLPEADVINQQHALTVFIELVTHLTGIKNKHKGRRGRGKQVQVEGKEERVNSRYNTTTCCQVSDITCDSNLTCDATL